MRSKAWIYVIGVLLCASAVIGIGFLMWQADADTWIALAALATLATVTQVWSARAPGHQSYHPAILFMFAGALLLTSAPFCLLIVVPHLVEWAYERFRKSPRLRNWYLQPFNVAVHVLAGTAARLVYDAVRVNAAVAMSSRVAGAGTLAALVYVFLNHALVGQAIVLARDVTWQESGILDLKNLAADFVMLCLGQVVAYLHAVNHWLILPALAPLTLMYRALTIPQLEHEASTDPKTGLLNAKRLLDALGDEIERSKRHSREFALVMTDLDLLRNINNTYGHLAGDEVLVTVASTIKQSIRSYDLAARFGGEEFVIVLPETSLEEARAYAERLRKTVEETEIPIETSETLLRATLSLGVAVFPSDGMTAEEIIHEADFAVYEAKRRGRNRVVCADAIPQAMRQETMPSGERTSYVPTPVYVPRPMPAANRVRRDASPQEPRDNVDPSAPEPAQEAEPVPERVARLRILLYALIGSISSLSLAVLWLGFAGKEPVDWLVVGAFCVLAAIAELLQIDVYGESTLSVGVGVSFAAAIVGGIPAVVATGAMTSLIHYVRRRPAWYKTLFNWGVHVLAGYSTVVCFNLVGSELSFASIWLLLAVTLPASLIYYMIESAMITLAVSLSQGGSKVTIWQEHYQWIMGHYVILCVIGVLLALAYATTGLVGIIVFAAPVLMMRYSQIMYMRKTRENVNKLKQMNADLLTARDRANLATNAVQEQNAELFMTMAKIIDARDPMVAGHSTRVRNYAVALARELGLSDERIEGVEQAAMLHDIGKIGISEQVLHKAGRLTPGEYEDIKQHAWLGGDLLETSAGLRHLSPFVVSHHERWDGGGYPHGLAGEQITLEARILSLCDAVEAMASDRPYRSALPWEAVLQEVLDCAGTQFDPNLSQAFVKMARRDGWDAETAWRGSDIFAEARKRRRAQEFVLEHAG